MFLHYQRSWFYPRGAIEQVDKLLCFCLINGPGLILGEQQNKPTNCCVSALSTVLVLSKGNNRISGQTAVFLHYQRSWFYPRGAIEQVDKLLCFCLINGPGLILGEQQNKPTNCCVSALSTVLVLSKGNNRISGQTAVFLHYQRSWFYPRRAIEQVDKLLCFCLINGTGFILGEQ